MQWTCLVLHHPEEREELFWDPAPIWPSRRRASGTCVGAADHPSRVTPAGSVHGVQVGAVALFHKVALEEEHLAYERALLIAVVDDQRTNAQVDAHHIEMGIGGEPQTFCPVLAQGLLSPG